MTLYIPTATDAQCLIRIPARCQSVKLKWATDHDSRHNGWLSSSFPSLPNMSCMPSHGNCLPLVVYSGLRGKEARRERRVQSNCRVVRRSSRAGWRIDHLGKSSVRPEVTKDTAPRAIPDVPATALCSGRQGGAERAATTEDYGFHKSLRRLPKGLLIESFYGQNPPQLRRSVPSDKNNEATHR